MKRLCYMKPIDKENQTRKTKPDEKAMAIVNDIVLISLEDEPISFARVESILPDAKKDWYQIKLLMLQIPLQVVTWILKDDYINGLEFHMNGKKMKMEKVESPMEEFPASNPLDRKDQKPEQKSNFSPQEKGPNQDATIISFPDRKKKNHDPESG